MIVYTGGTFDLFHEGHARLLARCAVLAGHTGAVVVALNTDEFVTAYKGKAPVQGYTARREVLLSSRYVTWVVPNIGGADSKPSIELVKPDIIAVGSDWQARDYHAQMGFTPQWLDERKIRLVFLPYTEGVSTTELRARA